MITLETLNQETVKIQQKAPKKLERRNWWGFNETDYNLDVTENIYIEVRYCDINKEWEAISNCIELARELTPFNDYYGDSVEELMAEATKIANEYIKKQQHIANQAELSAIPSKINHTLF